LFAEAGFPTGSGANRPNSARLSVVLLHEIANGLARLQELTTALSVQTP